MSLCPPFSAVIPLAQPKSLFAAGRTESSSLVVSEALLEEVAEKLVERGIEQERVIEFLALIGWLAERVDVPAEAVRSVIADDPDDDHILACAVVGKADYLVSYDPHFDCLEEEYQGVKITKALPFLWAVRGDRPPETTGAETENR